MTPFTLCIADTRNGRFGRIAPVDGVLRRIEATADFVSELDTELARATARPMARAEVPAAHARGVDYREVTPDDPRLLDELAKAFRFKGYSAVLHDARRAEAWSLLHRLPVELDIRDTLAPGLDAMLEEDITDLLALLHDAVRETAELETKLAAERAAALADQEKAHAAQLAEAVAKLGGGSEPEKQ